MTTTVTGITAERAQALEDSVAVIAEYIDDNPPVGVVVSPGYLSLPGSNKSSAQAPDTAGLRLTGDLDVRFYGTLDSLTGATFQTLVGKQSSTATAWMFRENSAGKLSLSVSADGTTIPTAAVCSVVTPAGTQASAVLWRKSDGRTQFFIENDFAQTITDGVTDGSNTISSPSANWTTDMIGLTVSGPGIAAGSVVTARPSSTSLTLSLATTATASALTLVFGTTFTDGSKWNQLGSDRTTSLGGSSLYTGASNPPVTIGAAGNGTTILAGKVRKVEIRNGLDGALVANPNFMNHDFSDPTVTDISGNIWSFTGFARIVPVSATVTSLGTTAQLATLSDVRSLNSRWGAATRHPVTGWFHVDDYGPVGVNPAMWTVAQCGAAYRACRTAAIAVIDKANARGATIYFPRGYYVLDVDPTVFDPYTGLNYAAGTTWDYLEHKGSISGRTVVSIDNGMDCHVFGHPGRLQGDGSQDQIMFATFTDIIADGNKSGQNGTNTHDGFHLPQHYGLRIIRSSPQNCDGHGYYNTANGEFGTGGQHILYDATIIDSTALNNNAEGWFCSAATRRTYYTNMRAYGNGRTQARIAGKTVAVNVTATDVINLSVDNNSTVSVSLVTGDTPAAVVTKINTALGTALAIVSNATVTRYRNPTGTPFTDGVGNGTTTFASATAAFTAADVNQIIVGVGIPRGTKILSRTDASHVVLSNTVPAGTGVSFSIGTNVILTASANSTTWVAGTKVSGTGIPAGAVIGAVVNGVSFTIVDGSGNPAAPKQQSIVGAGIITLNGKGSAQLTTKPITIQASTDTVTFTSPHHAIVGTTMVFSGLTGGAGITAGTTYYVKSVVSSTQVTLTTTAGGGGTTLDITSDGTANVIANSLARIMITSDTTGGISKVYLMAGSNTTILGNLGLTLSPSQANSDFNNYRVGANEYCGAYLDHSEAVVNGLFSDGNGGDGVRIHNVDSCHIDNLHATHNNGLGVYADAFDHSQGHGWESKMNCQDYGVASYRDTITESAEVLFDNGIEGYGASHDTTIFGVNGPGDKQTGGNDLDNRFADYSIVIQSGVAANGSFDIVYPKYGDGGVLGTLQDHR